MKRHDVIVVGNGILGLTLCYFLKKKSPNISIAFLRVVSRRRVDHDAVARIQGLVHQQKSSRTILGRLEPPKMW